MRGSGNEGDGVRFGGRMHPTPPNPPSEIDTNTALLHPFTPSELLNPRSIKQMAE